MRQVRDQKGITLIALVITIIVLLILAGVTIAMLTGGDSAPQKASEAKIINDIGTAKDAIALNASSLMADYYDAKYVQSGTDTNLASVLTYVAANTENDTGTGAGTGLFKGLKNVTATLSNGAITVTSTTALSRMGTNNASTNQVYQVTGTMTADGGINWTGASWIAQ